MTSLSGGNQEYQLTGINMYNNDVIEWR
jgi:hypothetical protein